MSQAPTCPPDSSERTCSFRAAAAYVALCSGPLLVLIDGACAWARGWRGESRFDQALLAIAALAATLLTAVVLLPRGCRAFKRRSPPLIALAISAWLGLVLAELMSIVAIRALEPPFHRRPPNSEHVMRTAPGVMTGVSAETRVSANSWGTRGPEPPRRDEAYRILCLGGSTTACTFLDDKEVWSARLMERLNARLPNEKVWVGNVGVPAYRAQEHLRFVEQSELTGEIDCLIVQAGINDFMDRLNDAPPPRPWWNDSHLWRLARLVGRRYAGTADLAVEDQAGLAYLRRRAKRQQAESCPQLPDLDGAIADYDARVRAIVAAGRRRGVRMIFTSQPTLWDRDLAEEIQRRFWFGELSDGRYLSVERMREGMDRYNDRLRRTCDELNVEFVDLESLSGQPAMFYDDCHFTVAGADAVAEILAQWFAEHPVAARERAR